MGEPVKPLSEMLAPCMSTDWSPADSLLVQLHANVLGKAAADDSNALAPAPAWETHTELFQTPNFGLI